MTATKSLTGCGEMSNAYTFSLTVETTDTPMSEAVVAIYIQSQLEGKGMVKVLNIVRDY